MIMIITADHNAYGAPMMNMSLWFVVLAAASVAAAADPVRACNRTDPLSPYLVFLKFHKVGGEAASDIVRRSCAMETLAAETKGLAPHNWYFMNNNAFTHQTITVYRMEGFDGFHNKIHPHGAKVLFVTVLRDPVEQHLSALYFWAEHHLWSTALREEIRRPRAWNASTFDALVDGFDPRKFGAHEALLTLARHRPDLDARQAALPYDDANEDAVTKAVSAASLNLASRAGVSFFSPPAINPSTRSLKGARRRGRRHAPARRELSGAPRARGRLGDEEGVYEGHEPRRGPRLQQVPRPAAAPEPRGAPERAGSGSRPKAAPGRPGALRLRGGAPRDAPRAPRTHHGRRRRAMARGLLPAPALRPRLTRVRAEGLPPQNRHRPGHVIDA